MKINIDTNNNIIVKNDNNGSEIIKLYSKESFELLSELWLKIGWNEKYFTTFSWLGRGILQMPEDMFRIQEVIYNLKPDVIIETGVYCGGSLMFYASLCKAMNKGRIIGVDININIDNRKAIEEHELFEYITLIEGDSVDKLVTNKIKSFIKAGQTVMVILDSCHTKEHVLNELEAYSGLVTKGSYIIVEDANISEFYELPKGIKGWKDNNPLAAILEFVSKHEEFIIEQPKWSFNYSNLDKNVTYWPNGWLKKI